MYIICILYVHNHYKYIICTLYISCKSIYLIIYYIWYIYIYSIYIYTYKPSANRDQPGIQVLVP